MPELNRFEEIIDNLKQYLNTNLEIVKLEVIERSSTFGSSMVGILVVGISVFLFVFTLSIGLGFYLSELLGNSYSGFAIIAGCHLLLALILFIGRKKLIEKPLCDQIIKKLLEKQIP